MNRTPSPLTLQLVQAMATDPASTEALRKFHRKRLAILQESVKTGPTARPSPFSRFLEKLTTETRNDPMKPKPMSQSDFARLAAAVREVIAADNESMEWWNHGPLAKEHHTMKYAHPDSITHQARKKEAYRIAEETHEALRATYPWLYDRWTPGYAGGAEPYVAGCYREALAAYLHTRHKRTLEAFRAEIRESGMTAEPPTSGFVFLERPQGFYRITKTTHAGKRVFAEDMMTGETVRLATMPAPRHYAYAERTTGYRAISEAAIADAVKLAKTFRDTLENAEPIAP